MKKFFGTDGLRAIAGEYPLQPYALKVIGMELAIELYKRLGKAPHIVIGGDTRESTIWIANSLAEGITSAQGIVEWTGIIPTPGIAYLTQHKNFDAGIVISASHNPYHDNGLKIFLPDGKKQNEELETILESAIETAPTLSPEADLQLLDTSNGLKCDDTLSASYIEFLCKQSSGINLSGLKIAIDCANGAASYYARVVFESLGARTLLIGAKPDGRNINKDCGSTHLETLSGFVVDMQADLGIAFDGDADRCLFVDNEGSVVDGDQTLFILANDLDIENQLNPRCVVATIMSNVGLELALKKQNIKLFRTKVGDRFVLDELLATGALLGGEQSGHIIFPKISFAGDGMLTALQILKVMNKRKASLKELTSGFNKHPQILVNVKVVKKIPFNDIPIVVEMVNQIENELEEQGRIFLRYSGTEPLARIMIEGQSMTQISQHAQSLATTIRNVLGA